MDHIVLFRWKPNTSKTKIEEIEKAITGLRETIPEIVDLTYGKTFSTDRAHGYSHALVVRLRKRSDLPLYSVNPDHLHVVDKFIKPSLEAITSLDIDAPRLNGFYSEDNDDDDDGDSFEERELRRKGSIPVPPELQPILMERLQHLQYDNENLAKTLNYMTTFALFGGIAFGIGCRVFTNFIYSKYNKT